MPTIEKLLIRIYNRQMTTRERDNGEPNRESHRASVEFLEASSFKDLTQQSICNGMQKIVHDRFEPWKKEFGGENRVYISLTWNNRLGDGTIETRRVEIDFEYSGTIVVKGGSRGSSTLLLKSWKNRRDVQRQALEKAIQHPMVSRISSNQPSRT